MLEMQSKWQHWELDLLILALQAFGSHSNHKPCFLYDATLGYSLNITRSVTAGYDGLQGSVAAV